MPTPFDADSVISTYGHDVLIRRRLNVVDGLGTHAVKRNDKYANYLERHTAFRVMQQPSTTKPAMKATPEGFVSDLDVRFYFRPGAEPKRADMVYEEVPHEREAYEKWIITRVVPFYIENELKYFVAHVTRLDPVS